MVLKSRKHIPDELRLNTDYKKKLHKEFEDLGQGKYRVIFPPNGRPDNITMVTEASQKPNITKGALVYDKPNDKGKGKLLKVITNQEEGEVEKVDKEWIKVKGKEEYIPVKYLDVVKALKDDVVVTNTNEVKNVDFDIEAGTVIGHTGKYTTYNKKWYKAVHIEAFTADSRFEDFFNNIAKDGAATKLYKTKPDTVFWYTKPLKTPLENGTKIKVFKVYDNYAQIGFDDITKAVPRAQLGSYKRVSGSDYYELKQDTFDEVQQIFDNHLNGTSDRLYWVSRCDKDGNEFSSTEESKKKKAVEENGSTYIPYRKVTLRAISKEKYWVAKDVIPENSVAQQWVVLQRDLERVYEKKPTAKTVSNEKLATPLSFKDKINEVTVGDKLWWKVKGMYRDTSDSLQYKEGWIEKLDESQDDYNASNEPNLEVLNPFDWKSFGWQKQEAPDQYLFQFEDEASAPDFIKQIWSLVDKPTEVIQEDGTKQIIASDRVLSPYEIRMAMRDKKKMRTLSHMVVRHHSEWNYADNRFPGLKAEITELFAKGIEAVEDAERKELLTKMRDEKLSLLEAKTKNLAFWTQITSGEVPEKDRSLRKKKEDKNKNTTVSSSALSQFNFSGGQHTIEQDNTYVAKSTMFNFSAYQNSSEANNNTLIAEEEKTSETGLPPRTFPSDSNVWHMHPIAFINQMKLMFPEQKTGECSCNRDLTTEEFKTIFTRIRKSEKLGNSILNHSNCAIPNDDKTFERLTEEFNKTTRKYGINQCIQKIHFIAQLYWESARFTTGLEFADGTGYNPGQHSDAAKMGHTVSGDGPKYKGRGFMQLTWRKSQVEYLKYAAKNTEGTLKGKTDAELELRSNNYEKYISDDLAYAMDSAGWFWSNYKKVAFNSSSSKTKYADILGKTLNEVALKGDKYTDIISIFVNGGGNGKSERKGYYRLLKNIFKYDYVCVNNENKQEVVSGEEAPWVKFVYQEFIEYQGVKENESPLKEKIKQYHNSSTAKGKAYDIAWCASFVSWCFDQAGYKKVNSGSNSFAFDWGPEGNQKAKDKSNSFKTPDPNLTGWVEGEECEAFIGAVIVLSYSHCAIIVGKNTSENKYVYIGGNQGRGVQEIKYGTVKIGSEYAIMKPISYQPKTYELPELNKNEDGSYATTH